ncbi:phosphoglycerate mutase-like protein 1 isoform X1 [Hevea brasiliensis]|uniref:phosphoglycerate mutase-like protein 1 isoform X1 n=1 Tax=Hevea brasiliensis TaxID=3981 RepID=UPI0025E7D983|nr:phosphoglycerate mutase-like protein 1 isoform X1 [Hevea brasiliensis]
MDATTAQFQCPLGHSKILHLLRHAQGIHNVAGEKDHSALLSPEFFDAPLSPLGCQQVTNLRNYVLASGLLKRIDLVITSPLLRSMQTAVEIFGSEESGLERPPIVAIELCRERLIESDDDILWKADVRETSEEIAARGLKFMNWLWTRQEREIAVVSHSKFLLYTLSALPIDCHPSLRSEICKQFENCELRSLMMVDKRMVAVTNKYLPVSSEEGNIRKHESQLQAYP